MQDVVKLWGWVFVAVSLTALAIPFLLVGGTLILAGMLPAKIGVWLLEPVDRVAKTGLNNVP